MRQMRATCAGYDEKECLEQIACQHTLDDLGDILDVNIVLLAREHVIDERNHIIYLER